MFIAADEEEILGFVERGECAVWAGERFDVGEGGVPLPFDDDGMDVFNFGAGVGDDGALGDLPVTIESAVTNFVNAHRDAIEIEVGELAVGGGSKINAAVGAEGEEIDENGVVGVVDRESEAGRGDDGVGHAFAEAARK